MKSPASFVVKYKTVSLTVFPWRHPSGHDYWRFKSDGKTVTCSTAEKARDKAKKVCEQTFLGQHRIPELSPEQSARFRRLLDADPSLALVDDFLAWRSRRCASKPIAEAREEFLAVKRANEGRSKHNVRTLSVILSRLPDGPIDLVTHRELESMLHGAPRTRLNTLRAWNTFFSWCRKSGYLPKGEDTAPEMIETPIIRRLIPATYTPEELAILFQNVRTEYFPWLALAAWAGLRTEEITPDLDSEKDGVRWEDFAWEKGILVIRPEVAKTGHKRVVPICVALARELRPIASTGRCVPFPAPHRITFESRLSETSRLGEFIGGWKRNALRHSFISYRAAQVGIAQAAMEAGNSESEAKKSYNDAKSKDEAKRWFSVQTKKPAG